MNTPDLPPEDLSAGGPSDDDLLAAELVLGVLEAEERRAALERFASEPEFSERVARWERHFAPWLGNIDPVAPSPQVWSKIQRRLGWEQRGSPSLWQSVALWRALTGLAATAALAIWLVRIPAPAPTPSVSAVRPASEAAAARPVTTLAEDNGSPGWLASVDRARGTVLMVPVPRAPDPQGRVPELWIIPAGKAPRSLGLVSIDKSHTVSVPADARAALIPGSVLAITLEPPGGVPHGAPTGPIIAKGAIQT